MSEPFVVYDIDRGRLREKGMNATNGPRIRVNEVPMAARSTKADPNLVQLRIGDGPAAHLDRARAAAVIEILAFWLASGRLWVEEEVGDAKQG